MVGDVGSECLAMTSAVSESWTTMTGADMADMGYLWWRLRRRSAPTFLLV